MKLYPHQKDAVKRLKNGSILVGGTGTGKSITAIAYYFTRVCGGELEPYMPMSDPRPLYIITTAKKRDDKEWDKDLAPFLLSSTDANIYLEDAPVIVDSWNNIKKYSNVSGSFFIFDEDRVCGSGAWVKAFYKIARKNQWIILSATPGDCWNDYIPVFVANGFYKHKTEFKELHMEMDPYCKYPKVRRWHNTGKLIRQKEAITVRMDFKKSTTPHHERILCKYDKDLEKRLWKDRWNIFEDRPLRDAGELCYAMRKLVNSDYSRCDTIFQLTLKHPRLIIFYNFDYELQALRDLCDEYGFNYAEWNGHRHEKIPETDDWLYLVQYTAGAEGWNCLTTCAMVFYSNNYSYKIMKQSEGRIDRLNTPFKDLYYYHLTSTSIIDKMIEKAIKVKKNFNESSIRW